MEKQFGFCVNLNSKKVHFITNSIMAQWVTSYDVLVIDFNQVYDTIN